MATFAHLSIVFTGYTPDRVVVTNTSGQQQEVFSSVLYCTALYCTVMYCTGVGHQRVHLDPGDGVPAGG